MTAKDSPQITFKNEPESRYHRLSRISMAVMIYGASGALLCLFLWFLTAVFALPRLSRFLLYPFSGCLLAFFLGVMGHVLLVCFGAMRVTLRSLLISTLTLSAGVSCVFSGSTMFLIVGLFLLGALSQFWLYHFFKASYEQDRRDGIV